MPNAQKELSARYERYREILRNLTLMSDAFMRNVLKVTACAEYVLQVILERRDLQVVDVIVQQDNKNLHGRSAVLDCVARDGDGRLFDVEVQQDSEGASPVRARARRAAPTNSARRSIRRNRSPRGHWRRSRC